MKKGTFSIAIVAVALLAVEIVFDSITGNYLIAACNVTIAVVLVWFAIGYINSKDRVDEDVGTPRDYSKMLSQRAQKSLNPYSREDNLSEF